MPAVSERDRRFALLVWMTSGGRRNRPPQRTFHKPEAAMDPDQQPVVTEANMERVRGGVTGHNVRYVLFGGIALVIVLFVLVAILMRH
jgi:hypothetical protein